MDRLGSFMVLTQDRQRKRRRDKSTPTGKTPLQKSKQVALEENRSPATQSAERTSIQWTDQEKALLFQYVHSHGDPQTCQENVTQYWKNCSEYLKLRLGTTRTGKSCRTRYDREMTFSGGKKYVAQKVERRDCGSQTDLSLPPNMYDERPTGTHREWSYLPASFEELKPVSLVTPIITGLHEFALRRLGGTEGLSARDIGLLLHTVLHSSEDIVQLAEAVFSITPLKDVLWRFFLEDIEACASSLTIRSRDSYLYAKEYSDLTNFSFDEVASELLKTNPLLSGVLLAVALPTSKIGNAQHTASLVPKLGLVHSILHQSRFQELSRLQKVLSVLMMNEHTHQKVYDQLQPLGICQEYSRVLHVVDSIGGHFNEQLIDAIRNGQKFRLVGDNVNFCTGVKYERLTAHKSMHHWFASAAIVQPIGFDHLPNSPQGKCVDLALTDIVPNNHDVSCLKRDYIVLIGRVAMTHMKNLSFIAKVIPYDTQSELTKQELSEKNTVVPLPTEPLNEQYYAEVVKILDSYETYVADAYTTAGFSTDGLQVHIGGDQLTRERFSGAKRLRGFCTDDNLRFAHLQPTTFEFFHLAMKYLSIIFKVLFSEKNNQKGTMNGEKIRTSRHSVHPNVKEHYDADKDFTISFINAYIVEALREFFGMDDANGQPSKHMPPNFATDHDRETWVHQTLTQFIDEMVWEPPITKEVTQASHNPHTFIPLQVTLPDGSIKIILIPTMSNQTKSKTITDKIKVYGHNVLQLGLLYQQLLDVCKTPCRERLLYTSKMLMVFIYTHNSRSKYALELLRFICHQQATLSLRVAHESLYGLFVNNAGRYNTHIPADLLMEHLVRRIKDLLKAVGPNKGKEAVLKRCKALPGMDVISENFDEAAGALKRSQKHRFKNATDDEKKMIDDLKQVNPFSFHADRQFDGFKDISLAYQGNASLSAAMKAWIASHQNGFDHEIGV